MFQFKILHRILATNGKLKQFNIKQSYYCGLGPGTIEHIFCECGISTSILKEVVDRLNKQGYFIGYLTDPQIILGEPMLYILMNIFVSSGRRTFCSNWSSRELHMPLGRANRNW